ncbi:MAG: C4-type zinc ribbon domain-containing protein [Candidatus Omnitrophota bacterium]
MVVASVRDQIKMLVELQKIDAEFYEHQNSLKEKPAKIEELKEAFERKKMFFHELEEKVKKKQLERKEREGDLQVKEGDIAKVNSQLSLLKTNKEYKAKLTEIENLKADKSIIEEKILILFDEVDTLTAKSHKEKEMLAQEEKKFLEEKAKIEDEIKQLDDRAKVLESQRQQKAKDIQPKFLNQYERILKGKEGLALVPVQHNACGGCYMNVPPQIVNAIKTHENLVYCESCARILYTEEDL